MDVYWKYVLETGDSSTKTVIASTASPFKFAGSVAGAILDEEKTRGKNEFELLKVLSEECEIPIPRALSDLDKKKVRHPAVCAAAGMENQVKKVLGL